MVKFLDWGRSLNLILAGVRVCKGLQCVCSLRLLIQLMWPKLVSHRVSWQLWEQKKEKSCGCGCRDACSSARSVSRDTALPFAIKSPPCSGKMKSPETCLKYFNFFSSNWLMRTKIFQDSNLIRFAYLGREWWSYLKVHLGIQMDYASRCHLSFLMKW